MSSFTSIMMAGSLRPVTGSNGSNAKEPAAASVKRHTIPLQARVKKVQKLESSEKTSIMFSRRDLALFLAVGSFSAATLSSPGPAEARVSKDEMKKKILEKLKMLREKVGLSKPETEKSEKIASPSPEKIPESPLPNLHNDLKKTVVEAATLP